MKYNPNPTPEDWEKAENSMSNEQKLSSDLRQMEIRPSQEQLWQIIAEDVNGGEWGDDVIVPEAARVPTEEEVNNFKKFLSLFKEILDSGYVDKLKEDDFAVSCIGTHEFEGREHANFFVNFDYKGEDYEFTFKIGSRVSRVASKLLPENLDEKFEGDTRNELLAVLKEEVKKDISSYIEEGEKRLLEI